MFFLENLMTQNTINTGELSTTMLILFIISFSVIGSTVYYLTSNKYFSDYTFIAFIITFTSIPIGFEKLGDFYWNKTTKKHLQSLKNYDNYAFAINNMYLGKNFRIDIYQKNCPSVKIEDIQLSKKLSILKYKPSEGQCQNMTASIICDSSKEINYCLQQISKAWDKIIM